jgi:RNA polymerase sigma-70 factor (ECF subfamily)
MDEREWLAERFEEHRARLRAVAYRMLGSLSEADDAVQAAWLRLNRTDARDVENLGGWLTTVVARISLNMLRSRTARREEPLTGGRARPGRRPAGRLRAGPPLAGAARRRGGRGSGARLRSDRRWTCGRR